MRCERFEGWVMVFGMAQRAMLALMQSHQRDSNH
jgi:hypothetical protein